ncbi:Fanconi anemia group M protein isoform X2 [Periplaneta americana]|uniref:Fanconi anemia group M protein isoform X2 n=1 Tax=Periplaneta americana TaxID=6978 RepID=UPI0037E74CD0
MSHNEVVDAVPLDNFHLLEDEDEDEILARALEESLRYYREVEVPLRQSQFEENGNPGTSRDGASCSRDIENPCRQSYHNAGIAVQRTSRDGTASCSNANMHLPDSNLGSLGNSVLYKGKDAEGFDLSSGNNWIYPTNYPVRQYQYDIVRSALFKNTLVCLPTGLGKTFIAAVVMYNFYRWFPKGKVIFMAPTKPLVNQQISSCYKVMGIPIEDTAEMTGSMSPTERAMAWNEKRVFFLTPHVLSNDLTCGICPALSIKCVVVDEAHKALGNYSYCQVMRALLPFNKTFRVLALSATPGSDIKAVIQVVNNLLISHIELRNEESSDIIEFSHKRNMQTVIVPLGDYLSSVTEHFLRIADKHVSILYKKKLIFGGMKDVSKYGVLKARDMFRQNPPSNILREQFGIIESAFAVLITLSHSFELLSMYGLRSFYKFLQDVLNESRSNATTHYQLKNDMELVELLDQLREKLGPDNEEDPEPDHSMVVPASDQDSGSYIYSHPKVEKLREIVVNHFTSFQKKNIVTRVMIFCQYREPVVEVCHILQKYHPLIKPMTFVGQSTGAGKSKGFTQKQQLLVMKKFKEGGYNTLISTCVGEEGLDIGEVDLIVCFDAHNSPIRLVQRMGRTGRQREGRIVMLVTEGREHAKFRASMNQNRSINKILLKGDLLATHMYACNPRMIPQGINPQCFRMHITVPAVEKESSKKKQRNHDIRTLLRNTNSTKVVGAKGSENTSPYCTMEELAGVWDGETVPEFDRLPDLEELHAKGRGEIMKILNSEDSWNEPDESRKVDYSEWLEWQRSLQPAELVKHSDDSKILVELLQYADSKRCQFQPTQTTGLLSQVNTSMLWSKKKKGKGKQRVKKSMPRAITEPTEADVQSLDKNDNVLADVTIRDVCLTAETVGENHFKCPAAVHFNPVIPEKMEVGEENLDPLDVEIIELPSDSDNVIQGDQPLLTGQAKNEVLDIEEVNDDECYFCKNDLFYCHITPTMPQRKLSKRSFECFEPLRPGILANIRKSSLAAFDLTQLLSPPSSPENNVSELKSEDELPVDDKPDNTAEMKLQKAAEDVKPNFSLNCSVFDNFLFEESWTAGNALKNDLPVLSEAQVLTTNTHSDHSRSCGITDEKAPELLQEVVLVEDKHVHESSDNNRCAPDEVSEQNFGERTPLKTRQTEIYPESVNNCSKQTLVNTSNVLLSPVSPIFNSSVKNCIQESPIFSSHKAGRMLPRCSTPKIHKKSLFSRKRMLEDKKEVEYSDNGSSNVGDPAQIGGELDEERDSVFNLPLPEVPCMQKPNFNLFAGSQWYEDFTSSAGNTQTSKNTREKMNVSANTLTNTNNSMYTITQFLNVIDRTVSVEKEKIPKENTLIRNVSLSDMLKNGDSKIKEESAGIAAIEHTPPKTSQSLDSGNDNENPDNLSHVSPILCSQIRHSVQRVTTKVSDLIVPRPKSSGHDKNSEQICVNQNYFHDSDDDIFAGLAIDPHDINPSNHTESGISTSISNKYIPVEISEEKTNLLVKDNSKCNENPPQMAVSNTSRKIVESDSQFSFITVAPRFTEGPSRAYVAEDDQSNAVKVNSRLSLKRKQRDKVEHSIKNGLVKSSEISPEPKRQKTDTDIESDKERRSLIKWTDFGEESDQFDSVSFNRNPLESNRNTKNEPNNCKTSTPEDDSPLTKNLAKNRRKNISSTSNESENSPNRDHQAESPGKINPLHLQDSGWLTADKSESSPSSRAKRIFPIVSDFKKNNSTGNKNFENKIEQLQETAVTEISSDDFDFASECGIGKRKKNRRKLGQKAVGGVSKKTKPGTHVFLNTEAEESDDCPCPSPSDDDMSDLDKYDSSFVSDSGNQTHTDIQAKFLHSLIRSPGGRQGQFKILPRQPDIKREDVFSQEEEEEVETSYLEDSFCVVEEPHSERWEASALEVAEALLEEESRWKRRKRKQKRQNSDSDVDEDRAIRNKKHHRRIVMAVSSDSEDDNKHISNTVQKQSHNRIPPSPENTRDQKERMTSECNTEIKRISSHEPQLKKECVITVDDKNIDDIIEGLDVSGWDDFDFPSLHEDYGVEDSNNIGQKSRDHAHQEQKCEATISKPAQDEPSEEPVNGAQSPVLTYSGHFKKLCSRVVRSLSTEFAKGAASNTSLNKNEQRRSVAVGNIVSPSSVTEPHKTSELEMSNISLKSSMDYKASLCNVADLSHGAKTVIMSTRQVVSAPEIATHLRAVYKFDVLVHSVPDADYVISWQLGVLRFTLTDFLRACPSKLELMRVVGSLRSSFLQRVLIAENDKQTPVVPSAGMHRNMWNKAAAMQLAYLHQAGITVLYSCDKADTARLLSRLANSEYSQSRGITPVSKNLKLSLENHVQFYQTLPGVNIALAMRICHMFPSVVDFFDSCSSVRKIQEVLGLTAEKSSQIYNVLHRVLKS